MSGILDGFRQWIAPPQGAGDNLFKLECYIAGPASLEEINSAWPNACLDPLLVKLWTECREAVLFRDVEYGQWGLRILAPAKSAELTASEPRERPGDFQLDDVVLAEFLGDQELLVVAPSERGDRSVLVALPLDPREEWYAVGANLEAFFTRYLEANGEKFWE